MTRLALALAALLALWLGSTFDSAGDMSGEATSSAGTDAAAVGTTAEAEGWAPLTRPSATPRAARNRQPGASTPEARRPNGRPLRGDGLNWHALAMCESGGNPRAVSASGRYRGLYQFDLETWRSVGGHGDPAQASRAEQTYRAQLLYRERGRSPWPVCGRRL